jgi:thiol-disulfide isomerase/thioredoxin
MRLRSLLGLLLLASAAPAVPALAAEPARPAAAPAPAPGYLGVQLAPAGAGLRIASVLPEGPAAAAGLREGDVIVGMRGGPPGSVTSFIAAVRAAGPGVRLPLQLERGGQRITVEVPLGTAPQLGVTVGAAAPALSAQLVMGPGPADLTALRGRVVLLDFWASWCGPCRAVMPGLNRLHQRYAAQGLSVLGVTDEEPEITRLVGAQLSLGYTLATDAHAAARFGVTGLPTLVVLDRRGQVRRVTVGADGNELRQLDSLVRQLLAEPAP